MKLNGTKRKICIVALSIPYCISLYANPPRRQLTFNGPQLVSIALFTGLGVTLGILWDVQRQEQANQPVSTAKKITQRTISALFGGVIGAVVGIGHYQQENQNNGTTSDNANNQPNPQPQQPTRQNNQQHNFPPHHREPARPVPNQPAAPLNDAQRLALRQAELRREIRAGTRSEDCPICMEKVNTTPAFWAFNCEHLMCNACLHNLQRTSRQPGDAATGNYAVPFVCPVCRANPVVNQVRL